ncbi:hypothetical protein [Larkinella arboricola]
MTNFFNKPKETVITGAFKTQTTIFSVTPTTRFERRCHILLVEDGEKMLAADVLTIMKSVLDDEIKSLQASCVTNRE